MAASRWRYERSIIIQGNLARVGETICNGVRLYWETHGEGPPVLLIAGAGAPPMTWHAGGFISTLVEAGYRVVAFANRGVEPSESPPAPYSVEQMAGDTAELIAALDLAPCRIVGYSLGGLIAEELCCRHAELLGDVVLLASAGRGSAFFRLYAQAQVELARALDAPASNRVASDRLLLTQPISVLQNDDETVEMMRSIVETSPPWRNPGRVGQWTAIADWARDDNRTARWELLTPRCLVISFEHDLAWPPSRSREAADAMPNAQYKEIAGAAHGGVLSHGAEVSHAVLDFFKESAP
jgi:pimeloyl-ACP methyl ester carboxylesterase